MQFYPLRDSLYAEMHSRPFQVIPSPACITHLVVLTPKQSRAQQFEHFQALFTQLNVAAPEQDDVCIQRNIEQLRVRREKHLEFVTYTFINFAVQVGQAPFSLTGMDVLPDGWLEAISGEVITAFHIWIEPSDEPDDLMMPRIKPVFDDLPLVGSRPQQGAAQIWTAFRLHADNFGRFMIVNHHMSDSQIGRLSQRLMEIETYRMMALMGLPLARQFNSQLGDIDEQLASLTQQLAGDGQTAMVVNEQQILAQLTDMAARVEDYRARSTFRFSATQAYHTLVMARLEALREDEVSGHLTLTEFMTRRLTPAVNTCQSVAERLEDMSRRIDRVSDMMRTRVELGIQSQNQQLLASMEHRSKIQLMMQHTVEGLSVVAISYYLLGLLKFLLDAIYDAGISFNKPLLLGISVPVVAGVVWLATRKIHKHFLALAKDEQHGSTKD